MDVYCSRGCAAVEFGNAGRNDGTKAKFNSNVLVEDSNWQEMRSPAQPKSTNVAKKAVEAVTGRGKPQKATGLPLRRKPRPVARRFQV